MQQQLPQLAIFGVNYKTAPFAIRQKLAITTTRLPQILERLHDSGLISEVLILSTCNRTELYCVTYDIAFVVDAICDIQNICPRTIKQYCYFHYGSTCARHLFKVIAGLDSMIFGETQIVAQVKEALSIARSCGTVKRELIGLFNIALAAEKDVRRETNINANCISFGGALLYLITDYLAQVALKKQCSVKTIKDNNYTFNKYKRKEQNEYLNSQAILFIGAGNLMEQIVIHFKRFSCRKAIINRTLSKAVTLAAEINAESYQLSSLNKIINDFSVIVVCCASDKLLLDSKMFTSEQQVLLIDISMPLVTDLAQNCPNVTSLTIDDIDRVLDISIDQRQEAALKADVIIEEKLLDYQNWRRKVDIAPLIVALRNYGNDIKQAALVEAFKTLRQGSAIEEVLDNIAEKLVNKLLHAPTVNLCNFEGKTLEDLTQLVSRLYSLPTENLLINDDADECKGVGVALNLKVSVG